jgi:arginine-tRNA-protein transferase
MYIIQPPDVTEEQACDYLPDRAWRFRYFFAMELDGAELAGLLGTGWRKFGYYYFKPDCRGCTACIPLRVCTGDFTPSRNQRDLLKRNRDVRMEIGPLRYSDRVYDIYEIHSMERFGSPRSRDDFIFNFYSPSCPALQSEYYVGDELAGVGFLDVAGDGLSSVYFMFDTKFSKLSLGTFSAIREIEYAASMKLPYYYLGYYIAECARMVYKARFRPHEFYDWTSGRWIRQDQAGNTAR